ncbi:MAG: methyltransferase domain-containing protein [Labilithrix sp.]|nr:methyltransferase domain-containing protein [Labilithrix sp.]
MFESPEELRAFTSELDQSTWTLAAIGALFESGLAAHLREPRTIEELAARLPALPAGRIRRIVAIAALSGLVSSEGDRHQLAPGAAPLAGPPRSIALAGDIRSTLMQAVAFLDDCLSPRASRGWLHTNPAILQAQGDASSALAGFLGELLPTIDDAGVRLARPGARFLDVGTGVGALAIAMCRVFPALAVVGLDVSDAALAIAKKNVAGASLGERIELRRLPIEDLREESAFDLAWLPSFFIPTTPVAAARIHAALRPGGHLVLAFGGTSSDPRSNAVWSLIEDLWGGAGAPPEEVPAILLRAGFSSTRAIPGPAWAPSLVVARRD